jgi:hypothetical protein
MKVVLAWVVGVLGVIGVGVGVEAGTGVGVALVAPRIDQIAVDVAATAYDPQPTSVTWVKVIDSTPIKLSPVSRPQAYGTLYVLEIRGRFNLGPPRETGQTFSDLEVLVTGDSFTPITSDASDHNKFSVDPDWTVIGAPETDNLAGWSPDNPLPMEPEPEPAGRA